MISMDPTTTLQSLRDKVKEFNQARDWEQFHTPQDLAVSISIEAAELLDIFRWEIKKDIDQQKLDRIKEELADIIIYSLGLANAIDADISTQPARYRVTLRPADVDDSIPLSGELAPPGKSVEAGEIEWTMSAQAED